MKSKKHVLLTAALCLTALAVLLSFTSCFLFPNNEKQSILEPEDLSVYELDSETGRLKSTAGADSLQALIEKSLDFIRHDCDYSKLKSVHDPVGFLAEYAILEWYGHRNLTFAQAREKATLLFGTADALKEADPDLYRRIYEDMDVMEPDEAVNQYMSGLRDAFRNGEIGPEDPKYDEYSRMLTDWDKGAEYMLEHYPDMFSGFNVRIGMNSALRFLREYATMKRFNEDLAVFKDLSTEFKPENITVRDDGTCTYDMGNVDRGNDVYMLDLDYYYDNGRYYIIGYDICVGSKGG